MSIVRILVQPADSGPSSKLLEPGPFGFKPPCVDFGGVDSLPVVWDGSVNERSFDMLVRAVASSLGHDVRAGFVWDLKVGGFWPTATWRLTVFDDKGIPSYWRFSRFDAPENRTVRAFSSEPKDMITSPWWVVRAWFMAALYTELIGGTLIAESTVR